MRRFYKKHRAVFDRFDNFLLQNPVLERGLTIAPVIVAGSTVKNGLALGIAFCIITGLTISVTYFIPRALPYTLRVICNALFASLVFIPTALLVEKLFPGSTFNLGIYLPLLVTNSLIVQKSGSRYHKMPAKEMLLQLFCSIAGFFLVIITVSAVREVLSRGTFYDNPIEWMRFTFPALSLPFGGFLITGFLSAAVQALRQWLHGGVKPAAVPAAVPAKAAVVTETPAPAPAVENSPAPAKESQAPAAVETPAPASEKAALKKRLLINAGNKDLDRIL